MPPTIFERIFDRLPFRVRQVGRFIYACYYRVRALWLTCGLYERDREPRTETWRRQP